MPEAVAPALERPEAHLGAHPDDVDALILAARFERLAARAPEIVAAPDLSRAHERIDRALELAPQSAAAHYWKSRLFGVVVLASEQRLRFEAIDVEAAIDYGSRAVDLEPDNLIYRETLAMLLAENLQPERALAVLEAVAANQHPIYLLLQDQARLPIPDGAVRSSLSHEEMQMIEGRQLIDEYERLRTWAWVVEGPASEVERFYGTTWPDFELFRFQEHDLGAGVLNRGYHQYFTPNDDSWRVAESSEELPAAGETRVHGITLRVEEMIAFPRPILARMVPDELLRGDPGRTFTMLLFVNHRFFIHSQDLSNYSPSLTSPEPPGEAESPAPDQ